MVIPCLFCMCVYMVVALASIPLHLCAGYTAGMRYKTIKLVWVGRVTFDSKEHFTPSRQSFWNAASRELFDFESKPPINRSGRRASYFPTLTPPSLTRAPSLVVDRTGSILTTMFKLLSSSTAKRAVRSASLRFNSSVAATGSSSLQVRRKLLRPPSVSFLLSVLPNTPPLETQPHQHL